MSDKIKNKESFVFYRSFYEAIQMLPSEDRLQIYDAISELALNGNQTETTGYASVVMKLIEPQILANNRKYKNACKGGRPKNQTETKPKPKKSYSLSVSSSVSSSISLKDKIHKKPSAPCSAGAKDLAKWMLHGFRTINPKFEAPRLALWANTIQAELSNGKSDYDIRAVFDFAISDDFWSGGGFKSPSGLFKHWNTITIKMHQTKKSGPDKKFEDNMSGIKKSWQKEIEKEKANGKDNLPKGLDAFDRLKAHNETKRIGK